MQLHVGKHRVHITVESMLWFLAATAAGTIIGELIYYKYVVPYLSDLPSLPGASSAPPVANVVATQPAQTPLPGVGKLSRLDHGRS